MPVLDMMSAVAVKILGSFFLNYIYALTYVIIISYIRAQHVKNLAFQDSNYTHPGKTPRQAIEEAIFFGLVSGFISSVAAVYIGIKIPASIVIYLFIIATLSAVINIRYICISYSGSILAFIGLAFRHSGIDVPSILILVALVHIIESVLVFFNAGLDRTPIFIKYREEIAGAFLINKYWPIPVVLLTTVSSNGAESAGGIAEISWKTLLNIGDAGTGVLALGLGCVIAVAGYSDIAITRQPEKKSRQHALLDACYSITLMAFASMSIRLYAFKVIGVIFSMAAHEGIALYEYHRERKSEPIFKAVKRGLRVFDILPQSHAEMMGMNRGDIILNINGRDVQTDGGVKEALKDFPTFTWIRVITAEGQEKIYEYKCYPHGYNDLGIISVPREKEVTYNIENFNNMGILKNLVARFRKT